MRKAWQIPVSSQGWGKRQRAHYMPVSKDTGLIVQAACGRTFNPGFAEPAPEPLQMCQACARKIYDAPITNTQRQPPPAPRNNPGE